MNKLLYKQDGGYLFVVLDFATCIARFRFLNNVNCSSCTNRDILPSGAFLSHGLTNAADVQPKMPQINYVWECCDVHAGSQHSAWAGLQCCSATLHTTLLAQACHAMFQACQHTVCGACKSVTIDDRFLSRRFAGQIIHTDTSADATGVKMCSTELVLEL